jgi:hypothetical protein
LIRLRSDEGERLQRASLGQRGNIGANIIDLNVKSLRHDWCK